MHGFRHPSSLLSVSIQERPDARFKELAGAGSLPNGERSLKVLVASDPDFVRALMRTALQEVLEAEMTETVGAAKGERTAERLGYRSGYYGRTLVTRVGKLELRGRERRSRPGSRG